jgi:hypothetical protein
VPRAVSANGEYRNNIVLWASENTVPQVCWYPDVLSNAVVKSFVTFCETKNLIFISPSFLIIYDSVYRLHRQAGFFGPQLVL